MRKSLYRRHNQVFLDLLRRYREQGKFRQRDLAQHLGSVQGTVSKAETGNRRLDVIELREWLLAMGVDFLAFMGELHGQLQSLSQVDSWPAYRPTETSSPFAPDRNDHIEDATGDGLPLPFAADELAQLLRALERARLELRPIDPSLQRDPESTQDARYDQALIALTDYLYGSWVPSLLREWQAHWQRRSTDQG